MKPSKINRVLAVLGVAGLIFTYSCGGSDSSGSTYNASDNESRAGVTISNEVSSPKEMQVGDLMMLKYNYGETAEFDFEGVDPNSEYFLVVGSLDTNSSSHTALIGSDLDAPFVASEAVLVDGDVDEWREMSTQDALDQRLNAINEMNARNPNRQLATPSANLSMSKAAVASKAVAVGDTKRFKVLSDMSFGSYEDVSGRARCVTDNVIVYVDIEVESTNPTDLLDSDVEMLCEEFDRAYVLEVQLFGEPSDVNGDGKVAALMTPQVNRFGGSGGGVVTGFFLSDDLFSKSDVGNGNSNEMEIFYTLVPDSRGTYSSVISKSTAINNYLTAVFPHELQHVISYNQHAIAGGGVNESSWLNEGMSHLTEDLVGYNHENYARAKNYLDDTTYYRLVTTASPDLGERGASYLFLRFLYEQSPNPEQFIWNLYHAGKVGIDNLENAFAGTAASFDQFEEFFLRWMAALAMTNQGISVDERYVYDERTRNADTGAYEGVCLVCNTGNSRNTVLSGPSIQTYNNSANLTLYSSTLQTYNVNTVPDKISFNASRSGQYGAVLIRKQ